MVAPSSVRRDRRARINTIRTLSIDAIQKANSGHPGDADGAGARSPTCSGSASCASTPTSRSGRTATASCSRPATPRCCSTRCCISPGSGRSIPTTRSMGAPSITLEDIESFRQLDSKAAGHPEYRWTSGVETTTGPLGQGVATSVGMAVAVEVAGRALQPAGLRALRLRRLRDLRRRRPDGGRLARGRLDRRPSAARQPLLDLRQQPHLDRRPDRDHLRRRRRRALHGLRLERHPGRRRQRPRPDHPRVRRLPGDRATGRR